MKKYICSGAGQLAVCRGCRHAMPEEPPLVQWGSFRCPKAKGFTVLVRIEEVASAGK